MTDELDLLQREKNTLSTAVRSLQAEINTQKTRVLEESNKADKDIAKLNAATELKKAELRDALGPLQGQIDQLKAQVARGQEQVKATEEDYNQKITAKQAALALVDDRLKGHSVQLEAMTKYLGEMKAKVAAL